MFTTHFGKHRSKPRNAVIVERSTVCGSQPDLCPEMLGHLGMSPERVEEGLCYDQMRGGKPAGGQCQPARSSLPGPTDRLALIRRADFASPSIFCWGVGGNDTASFILLQGVHEGFNGLRGHVLGFSKMLPSTFPQRINLMLDFWWLLALIWRHLVVPMCGWRHAGRRRITRGAARQRQQTPPALLAEQLLDGIHNRAPTPLGFVAPDPVTIGLPADRNAPTIARDEDRPG